MASKSIIDLEKCIDKEVRVKFQGDREDPDDPYRLTDKTRKLGLVVCRGLQVSLVSPVDGMEEIANPFIQHSEI
ncbi:U6 small nuclear RNA and mRNA degradation associated [Aureococcus anophagefferens]|uniref:U6 small nuclear RNA and mRNA degradation associated n=1 Tax=Aureococcus anophagefferens TaxID=44056 RepID=A0ABR1G9V7_AURAN